MEGAPGGSLCDIPSSLPSQLLLRFDWTKFSLPHSHALTLSTLIYFKRGFFYSLILHRRFSSLIFFNACHFVIPSPVMYVAQLIWNAWVSGTDIWTVLCGRLFVAQMRRISFGISKRMHPTEWEILTIDRQADRQTDRHRRSKRSFCDDEWRRIWKEWVVVLRTCPNGERLISMQKRKKQTYVCHSVDTPPSVEEHIILRLQILLFSKCLLILL